MKNHSVHFELAPIPQLSVNGRESQLVQVLLNLLNNSVDALESSDQREIRIDFKIHGPDLQILVSDSGPGIKSEHKSKLTEPFFTTKPPGKGTGLGLSISRGIMESHFGHLIHLTDSKKTCFMIEIPILKLSDEPISQRQSA
jgi:signal transduction histidine kinase